MDAKELEAKWDETVKKAFDEFIEKNVGTGDTKEPLPACYGSGDDKKYCNFCALQSSC